MRCYCDCGVDSLCTVKRLGYELIDIQYDYRYVLCTSDRFINELMGTKYNQLKTVGAQMARLLMALHDRSQATFTLRDVQQITDLKPASASDLIYRACRRGLISRLKRGLFVIVPSELGSATEYAGNPYLIAQRLAGEAPCFISHASAMEIHRMVTQPQFVVFASSAKRIHRRTIQQIEFHFVLIKPQHFFGHTKHWVTKQESVNVSDLERTVIDGLHHPDYCGGLTEVAKGLWMRRAEMKPSTLVDYALRLNVGAVTRRLGYLLELYAIGSDHEWSRLQKTLTATYVALDPLLPKEGKHIKRWRLQLNVSVEELQGVRTT